MRPATADLLVPAHGFAFPSGHAQAAAVTYPAATLVVVLLLSAQGRRAARAVSAALVLLLVGAVGVSRVFLGAHWPSDVLAGWLVGSAWVGCAVGVLMTMQERLRSRLQGQRTSK